MTPDIRLSSFEDLFFVDPVKAVGLAWLQLHFPEEEWAYLSMGACFLDCTSAAALALDAEDAGLLVEITKLKENFIPGLHD